MALLDIIGLGADKQAIILDIGEAFTKVGFAGEPIPRHVVRSEITRLRGDEVEVINVMQHNASAEELFTILRDFLHNIYFKYLLVNPKERRVVVGESILCPVKFRSVLANVLFKHFEVLSLLLAPSHLLAMLTLGVPSALVVDCGYRETLVVPVYESTPVMSAMQDIPLGAFELHRTILTEIKEKGKLFGKDGSKPAASSLNSLKERVLEDIKVKLCFVGRHGAPETLVPLPVKYPLSDDSIVEVPGSVRCKAYDIFFNGNEEGQSVASIILDSIAKCPIDCRKAMANNILLVGGTVLAPGFESRLISEINALLASEAYFDKLAFKTVQIRRAPVPANYASWLGGAIYGALEILSDNSVSREKYNNGALLPDWASILQYNVNAAKKDTPDKGPKWQPFKKSLAVGVKSSK